MRQGQQHRRGRTRNNNGGSSSHHQGHGNGNISNNNNRKGQNPLTRSFESNGPDVKIRGTPAHVAEKYVALARDAHAVGDTVLAENYLQHAEHYYRIILAYREQQGETGPAGGNHMRPRPSGDPSVDGEFGDDDNDEYSNNDGGVQPLVRGNEPQPGGFDTPRFDAPRTDERPYRDNNAPRHQPNRHNNSNRDRQPGDRQDGGEPRRFQNDRPDFRGPDSRGESRGDGRSDNRRDQHQPNRSEGRPERFDRPERGGERGGDRGPDRGGERPVDRNFDRGGEQPSINMRSEPDQRPSPRFERPERPERPERIERPERVDRHELVDRQPSIPAVVAEQPVAAEPVRRREPRAVPVPSHDTPEFLRRPVVRRPKREVVAESTGEAPPAPDDKGNQE